jgi:hypothetical protein
MHKKPLDIYYYSKSFTSCHSERSEESKKTQDKLHEEFRLFNALIEILRPDKSGLRMTS